VRTYIEAIVWQLTNGLGDVPPSEASRAEDAAATRVLGFVEAASGGAIAFEGGVDALAKDAVLLSAFFQNLDLLPAEHDPHVDAIALLVGDAVHRLSASFDSGPDAV
jgi:hypothetical protein